MRTYRLATAIAVSLLSCTCFAQTFEAEPATRIGGAARVTDSAASGGGLVGLIQPGQGVKFAGLPAAGRLAIRYASVEVGTISVAVNDQPARKVNVHSSGALTGSFLHAVIDVAMDWQVRTPPPSGGERFEEGSQRRERQVTV